MCNIQSNPLNLSRRRPLSYRNQSIDLQSKKKMDWFLYDNGLCLERVKKLRNIEIELKMRCLLNTM